MLVNQRKYAEMHKVHRSTVRRWNEAGLLVTDGRLINVEQSNALIAKRPEEYRGGTTKSADVKPEPTANGTSLAEAKRIRAAFDALLAEYRRDKLGDSLAPVDAAIAGIAAEHVIARGRLRAVPGWLAPHLVGVSAAPLAATYTTKAFRGALHDLSKEDHEPAWDGDLSNAPLPDANTRIYYVDHLGEVHYSRRAVEPVEPPAAETTKKKRRRRSTPVIEAAIAEAGAENEIDNSFIVELERAVGAMTITEARARKEVAEGDIRRIEYQKLKRQLVSVDRIYAALTANNAAVRNNVMGIASKSAPRIALLTNAKAIEQVISKEVELVLDDLANPKTLVERCMND